MIATTTAEALRGISPASSGREEARSFIADLRALSQFREKMAKAATAATAKRIHWGISLVQNTWESPLSLNQSMSV